VGSLARITSLRAKWEAQWHRGPATTWRPVEYLTELGEVQDLATWVCEQIMNHIAQGGQIKDMDLMHLPIQLQFYASRYT
jgi:hypothetical protein